MLAYILQVVLFQLLFLLVYEVLLKKETFFTYNRWYLLATSVVSLLLPLIKIESLAFLLPAESISEISNIWLPEVYIGDTPAAVPVVHTPASAGISINWWLMAYGAGVVASMFLFFKKYQDLSRLFRFRAITAEKDLRIIEVPNSTIACTFYKTIFLGDKLSEAERQQILSHELVHVKQKHSLDLVFFELYKIIFWFNPLIYVYQNRIASLHEFIADAEVVESAGKRTYYEQLLNSAFNTTNISFINQFFNHSLIKKRIVMLQKSKSKSISKIKYLALLPLMLVMLTYVSCSDENSTINSTQEESLSQYTYSMHLGEEMSDEKRKVHNAYEDFLTNNPAYVSWATIEGDQVTYSVHSVDEVVPEGYTKLEVSLDPDNMYLMYMNLPERDQKLKQVEQASDKGYDAVDGVPFGLIEQVPLFPGCENAGNNEEQKQCMSDKIRNYVLRNFDTSLGEKLGLTGVNRVIVVFRINEQGQITEVRARAPHPDLEVEAKRVVEGLPQMTPGLQDGQKVAVSYSLPIIFQVGE